ERAKAIPDEVQKLVKTGIMREVLDVLEVFGKNRPSSVRRTQRQIAEESIRATGHRINPKSNSTTAVAIAGTRVATNNGQKDENQANSPPNHDAKGGVRCGRSQLAQATTDQHASGQAHGQWHCDYNTVALRISRSCARRSDETSCNARSTRRTQWSWLGFDNGRENIWTHLLSVLRTRWSTSNTVRT
ncbi:hypothetical protein Tco_0076954, partial [Tanacetum coccineum]